jgi:hypothetical protein
MSASGSPRRHRRAAGDLYMTQAPGAIRTDYRQVIPSLVSQALE